MSASSPLPRSTPESQGVASSAIAGFVNRVNTTVTSLHSFMLLRHGQVIAEGWWQPYAPERRHVLFSLSKSFTATAIGIAVAEKRFAVDDKVISFFPADLPATVNAHLAAMRIWDLLTMSTGHSVDSTGKLQQSVDGNWPKAFLAHPVEHAPGTHFVYNSGATYMLSAILQRVTGVRMLEYLTPRLFAPLGIVDPLWEQDPRGVDVGGWGLKITTEDIAKFGQLYLQRGAWQDAQLVAPDWVAAATSKQVNNAPNSNPDWEQGYGYQFWRCRHNAYRGDGAFGQYCIVLPDHDAVLAITSGVADMQAVLTIAWDMLLPAFMRGALPPNVTAHNALRDTLVSLEMRRAQGARHSPLAARIFGRTYRLDANPDGITTLRIDAQNDGVTLTLQAPRGDDVIACGYGDWRESRIVASVDRPALSSGTYAWSDDNTLALILCLSETPFVRTHTLRIGNNGDALEFETHMNVGFLPQSPVIVIGQAID